MDSSESHDEEQARQRWGSNRLRLLGTSALELRRFCLGVVDVVEVVDLLFARVRLSGG